MRQVTGGGGGAAEPEAAQAAERADHQWHPGGVWPVALAGEASSLTS